MNYIFFHISTIGQYQTIVNEIYDSIFNSGLIDKVEKIYVTILGNKEVEIPDKSKTEIIYRSNDLSLYEFPTLQSLKDFSKENNGNILYIHTKGATNNTKPISDWRQYMLYFNIYRHKDSLEKLKEYDTCGVDLRKEPVLHYSGNFWWSTTNYIKTLMEFKDMKVVLTERHKCEFWICSGNGKYFCQWDSGINVYERHLHEYDEKNYKNG